MSKCSWVLIVVLLRLMCRCQSLVHIESYEFKVANVSSDKFHQVMVSPDEFVCVLDREFESCCNSFRIAMCMIPLSSWMLNDCHDLFGSQSLVLRTNGSLEVVGFSNIASVAQLTESTHNMRKLLDIDVFSSGKNFEHHIVQVQSISTVMCLRSTDPRKAGSVANIMLRDIFTRDKDQREVIRRIAYHLGVVVLSASSWLVPYVGSIAIGLAAFEHGLQVLAGLLGFCGLAICLTPLMMMKKNRKSLSLYLAYFLRNGNPEEVKEQMRKRQTILHAVFLSSLALIFGCVTTYFCYQFAGFDREIRNFVLKLIISFSVCWVTFFVLRLFDQLATMTLWMTFTHSTLGQLNSRWNLDCKIALTIYLYALSAFFCIVAKTWLFQSTMYRRLVTSVMTNREFFKDLFTKKIR